MSDSTVNDPVLGKISVYREHKPINDEIEYTVFFRVNDKKYRHDFTVDSRDFETIPEEGAENFIRNRMLDNIRAGDFVSASDFETPLSDEEKKEVLSVLAKKAVEGLRKMHEAQPLRGLQDDKWKDEREANDARRDAYSTTEAADAAATSEGFAAGVLSATGPSETELVIVALLMRLYDVNMALLSHFDKPTADRIYDSHNEGGHFNPQIFIPSAGDEDGNDNVS